MYNNYHALILHFKKESLLQYNVFKEFNVGGLVLFNQVTENHGIDDCRSSANDRTMPFNTRIHARAR